MARQPGTEWRPSAFITGLTQQLALGIVQDSYSFADVNSGVVATLERRCGPDQR